MPLPTSRGPRSAAVFPARLAEAREVDIPLFIGQVAGGMTCDSSGQFETNPNALETPTKTLFPCDNTFEPIGPQLLQRRRPK